MYQVRNHSTRNKLVLIAGVLLVVGALGYGGWYFLQQQAVDENTQALEENENIDRDQNGNEESEKEYSSSNPALSFSYPGDWTVTEDEDEGSILVESLPFTFQVVGGDSIEGNFRIFMRQTAREQEARYIGRGVAITSSEVLVYDNPSVNQRDETRLSFFGLDSTDNFAFFLIAGNFSLETGDILGANFGREEGTYIIGGGYSAPDLEDIMATHLVPADTFTDSEAYMQALEILRSIRLGAPSS